MTEMFSKSSACAVPVAQGGDWPRSGRNRCWQALQPEQGRCDLDRDSGLFGRRHRGQRSASHARMMRAQASSSSSVAVAYEMRRYGSRPNAAPCTAATPSRSRR